MFKFNKKFLFIVFALCLFAIGAKISLIIYNGRFGKDFIFTIILLLSLTISSIVLYRKIYKDSNDVKSE